MTAKMISVCNLVAEYGSGSARHRAVNDVSFEVHAGECVGFIGPNGAGKSTTMKIMMGFMFPASGKVEVFGEPPGSVESRRRLGYLPEVTLYYPFMKAGELLWLYGGLQGMGRAQLRERIPTILKEVGLEGKEGVLLRNFSKGMQQRLGIAQAIIAEPEMLIFDELSSGLDPVGRYDLRDVLLRLKAAGRTIFFSSHELSEVESLCDRVIMIHKGRVVCESSVEALKRPLNRFEIAFRLPAGADAVEGFAVRRDGDKLHTTAQGQEEFNRALQAIAARGGSVLSTTSVSRSLEEHFIELVRGGAA